MEIKDVYFKYRSLNANTLCALSSGDVWYSERAGLNDPFDCLPTIERDIEKSQALEVMRRFGVDETNTSANTDWVKIIEHCLRSQIEKMGVFCTSISSDNELMWSHYADSHKGIAIGYKILEEVADDSRCPHQLPREVSYEGRGAAKLSDFCCWYLRKPGWRESLNALCKAFYFSKNPAWKYENEYRLLSVNESGLLHLGADINCIVFGFRTPKDHMQLVRDLLGHKVNYYQAQLEGDKIACYPENA